MWCYLPTLVLLIRVISGQQFSNCESSEMCGECIQKVGCVWCVNPSDHIHCKSKQVDPSNWCSDLVNPTTVYNVTKNINLETGVGGNSVQIKPQKIRLDIRKGEEQTIVFQYARASNYPLDLYYIMDLSHTMKSHKDKLSELGDKLVEVMRNSTTDFRLGFGSFVDKAIMPFTQTGRDYAYSSCENCTRAYSFKNHLSLTTDYEHFTREVSNSQVSTNVDLPEGGFDALMQAIVCKEQIGWRDNARHLIVFSTDYLSHFAGDGKLAGLYEPNDGQCHLEGNDYVELVERDYPSLGHLEHVAKVNNIHLIFAIPQVKVQYMFDDVFESYRELSKNFANSRIGKLDHDSSNIVYLIKDTFETITDSVCITDNATSTVEIRYSNSKCQQQTCCDNIQINEVINFTATIKPLECPPANAQTSQYITIKPEGVNEALTIELNVICECPCEKSDAILAATTDCSGNGKKICGICECSSGFFGKSCECDFSSSATSVDDMDSNCKKDPNATEVCSGSGFCRCGTCVCKERPPPQQIYGKYCECDNFSCKRVKGELCSGTNNGKCACGKCECRPGWSGEDCGCSTSQNACAARKNGEICSGHGKCVCGECKCESDENNYYGRYCEECPTCPGQRCEELLECVQAATSNSTNSDYNNISSNCTEYEMRFVDNIQDIDEGHLEDGAKICREIDEAGCTIIFKYNYGKGEKVVIEMSRERSCPKPLDTLTIVVIIISSIILGGLIMLIVWKVLTHIHDAKEYANFLEERENCKWHLDSNPIYKEASTRVVNPLFGVKKDW